MQERAEEAAPAPQVVPELDSAMATGNDDGEPGDRSDGPPPELVDPGPDAAVEETPEAVAAVHDDSVLHVGSAAAAEPAADDPLTPEFREPAAD